MNRFTKIFYVFIFLLTTNAAFAQRIKQTINDGWSFALYDGDASAKEFNSSDWQRVSIPHTWNAQDSDDEVKGFYRGNGWYRKLVNVEALVADQRVFITFEAANQEADVYVNGKHVGNHKGGYSAFTFDITDAVELGTNIVAVKVDNHANPDIAPLSADFTFFGGIYRDVYLVYTPQAMISPTHYSTSGVYLTTPEISDAKASVVAKTYLSNGSADKQKLTLQTQIVDAEGQLVTVVEDKIKIDAQVENVLFETSLEIANPTRWDVDDPYMYRVYSRLFDAAGNELDCVVNPLGIREYSFDPKTGFTLNGRNLKLMGTNRHQDYLGLGNALRDEMHVRDVKLIKEMGSNFFRVSHYPQDPAVMQQCDQLGLLTSVEIPIVNAITLSEAFKQNCIDQTIEMVHQDFNSPSVIIWAYMNEVMLRPPYDKEDESARIEYMEYLYDIASEIENTIRELDPARYTMLPCHSAYRTYQQARISELPMILGFNIYNGWYSGHFSGFEAMLDVLHEQFPNQSLFVSEYGADVDPRLHSFNPQRFDFSCEFGNLYHEHYIPEILKRDFIFGGTVWNLNDFFSEGRSDAVPHVNNKGIVGTNRERKDTYRLYQAYLKNTPVVHITNERWASRAGASEDGETVTQPLKIYTNASEVKVIMNGKSLGTLPVENHIATMDVDFIDGENVIEAVIVSDGVEYRDQYVCDFKCVNVKNNFTEMSVMLGSNRYFEDRTAELCWIPEQEYTAGSWGYVGGEKVVTKTRYGSLPASEIEILGTDQDPVFQTQRSGIEAFKADVPDGSYAIYLYFAELTSENKREALAYNLGNDAIEVEYQNRVFAIDINGTRVANDFNIAEEYGSEHAVIKKYIVSTSNGEGITIDFEAIESEPVVSAVRIVKQY